MIAWQEGARFSSSFSCWENVKKDSHFWTLEIRRPSSGLNNLFGQITDTPASCPRPDASWGGTSLPLGGASSLPYTVIARPIGGTISKNKQGGSRTSSRLTACVLDNSSYWASANWNQTFSAHNNTSCKLLSHLADKTFAPILNIKNARQKSRNKFEKWAQYRLSRKYIKRNTPRHDIAQVFSWELFLRDSHVSLISHRLRSQFVKLSDTAPNYSSSFND